MQSQLTSPRLQRLGDPALAAAIAVLGLVEIAIRHGSAWYGPVWIDVCAALLCSLPLLFRGRFPLPVLVAVLAGSVLAGAYAGSRQGPLQVFVALVVAAYSVGAHEDRARLGFAFAVVPAAIATAVSSGALPFVIWTFGFWLVGRVIRSWRERARSLERLTRELESQRELQAEAAVAVERGRIARELHDVIAHNVSMIVVQAAAAARVLRGDEPDVRAALDAIETTGRETVDEMRRMLGVVRSDGTASLAPQPTLRDVERLVANVREAGLPVDLRVEGEPIALAPGIDLSAFRIVQEALTNALKHAGDARAVVTLRYVRDRVEVEILDDGDGAGAGGGSGNGLIGMRERVAVWGGELEARRRDEGGFLVRATLPAAP
ncbi:MAG TPA: histidine kinase [Gaiellaceae bacterium]